jgi:tetrahydromethanopterin:alpha-L-glutamate ligase
MFHVAVLAQSDSWYARDLQRAAKADESIAIASYRDLCVAMHNGMQFRRSTSASESTAADKVDTILVRSMPLGSLEQVIFRVNALHAAQSAGIYVANSPRTCEIAIDKWLTLATVAQRGIETPRTFVCQTRDQALEAFEQLNRDVVVKPIFGGEGRGIMRVSCPDLAWRVFGTLEVNQSVIYLQEYIEHASDLRILVIGDQAFAMRRTNTQDWRTNISRGGCGTLHQPTKQELHIAYESMSALKADFLGVDLIYAADGRLLLIEVNAVPGWKALAKVHNVDIARLMLDHLRQRSHR